MYLPTNGAEATHCTIPSPMPTDTQSTAEMVMLEEASPDVSDTVKTPRRPLSMIRAVKHLALWQRPWLGWVFAYAVVLLFFFVYRCIGLKPLILMYGTKADCTAGVEVAALGLGFLEDLVCATYFACALWAFDSAKWSIGDRLGVRGGFLDISERRKVTAVRVCGGVVTFLVSWILFVAMMAPFVADLLIVRLRNMRFTFELVAMAIHEKDNASSASISQSEINEAYRNVSGLLVVATVFAAVRTWADWADLSRWNPAFALVDFVLARAAREKVTSDRGSHDKRTVKGEAAVLETGEPTSYMVTTSPQNLSNSDATTDKSTVSAMSGFSRLMLFRLGALVVLLVLGLIVLPVVVLAISRASPSMVAYSGLNATLNELFIRGFDVTAQGFTPTVADGSIQHASIYIHSATEEYTLFKDDSLYRRTTGFQGDLAFDVNVSDENPPNVLLVVIESFRFHDSHYLVGEEDPSNLFKGTNITITPNFDRWAKRGVAFSNMWSSWRTSRSVESLLFAQLPYDSVADSGMTGGKEDVELAGLPQLFKAKGYEPFFTTGCKTDYDDWNKFLPSHGFETVWSRDEMMQLAEGYLNISSDDWNGDAHRALGWGVHDDLSFTILGDLLINKTKEQSDRVAQGEAKKPLFLNHYTISSHTPFRDRPKWYAEAMKPNFSALYEGEEYADDVQAYLEMRYFTDMQLGKFLDRMSDEGILNDTIVVVVGDHGQAPEFGLDVPEARELSCTRVAGTIIAEGRLGDAVGLMIDDAVEQYDILNTLADITGVPSEGFLQDGIGRSLKRSIPFGERVVYSNNPSRKMSVVRGHERLRYDRYSSSLLLHNADIDHEMKTDEYPALSAKSKSYWRTSGETTTFSDPCNATILNRVSGLTRMSSRAVLADCVLLDSWSERGAREGSNAATGDLLIVTQASLTSNRNQRRGGCRSKAVFLTSISHEGDVSEFCLVLSNLLAFTQSFVHPDSVRRSSIVMVERDSIAKGQLSTHYGFPSAVSGDATEDYPSKDPGLSKGPAIVQWFKLQAMTQLTQQWGHPWSGWAFVYGFALLVFFIYRCTALKALFAMYAAVKDGTPGVVLGALTLGLLEDFVCATYFACALWLFDTTKSVVIRCFPQLNRPGFARLATKAATFLVSWVLFLAMEIPFVADVIIVRLRDMRFTFDIVTMAIDEKDNATSFEVSNGEIAAATLNAVGLVAAATYFAFVRTWAHWADLSNWNPTKLSFVDTNTYCVGRSSTCRTKQKHRPSGRADSDNSEGSKDSSSPTEDTQLNPDHELSSRVKANKIRHGDDDGNGEERVDPTQTARYVVVEMDESASPDTRKLNDDDICSGNTSFESRSSSRMGEYRLYLNQSVILVFALVLFPLLVVEISRASSPLIAYSALNTTLNELFKHALQPPVRQVTPSADDDSLPWVEAFIDYKTEQHTLFGYDTLYRRTTGFQGDLAFDVNVTEEDPPNVLVIVVEAFRFHDSHYLVGEEDPSNLFKGSNITITPNFDKWAKRGIALRNFWSSWRTSRSVESIQFGQIPYDSVTKSGMSGGRRDTELAGLPQLFTAKGYETFFTTGCLTSYDGWDLFLPAHGFDTVWSRDEMEEIAENNFGIKPEDWDGSEHRGLNWGVHDDLSFRILGDLMVNKTKEQRARVESGEPKKPLYLNHYTISSHVDYKQRPKWYDEAKKPNFSALYEGEEYADNIKNYLEMRYFADVEMGKFLDRMEKEGILNDTIIVPLLLKGV
ncbi:unnamed protein product [Phytophthora fragariaefolia]|uniref:Unnamed protein product n=1 Tax=Phytophthora fragariaefolia TaxID=1490495 RepID=A0A9W6YBS2_9STRA|nr:unnamed protein product [Phytophthora fragariaefolia]